MNKIKLIHFKTKYLEKKCLKEERQSNRIKLMYLSCNIRLFKRRKTIESNQVDSFKTKYLVKVFKRRETIESNQVDSFQIKYLEKKVFKSGENNGMESSWFIRNRIGFWRSNCKRSRTGEEPRKWGHRSPAASKKKNKKARKKRINGGTMRHFATILRTARLNVTYLATTAPSDTVFIHPSIHPTGSGPRRRKTQEERKTETSLCWPRVVAMDTCLIEIDVIV